MIHRIDIGTSSFTSLEVASMPRAIKDLGDTFPDISSQDLARATEGAETMTWSFNLSLFEVGGKVVLADTGFHFDGEGPAASTKSLLAEAGIEPGQVDEVVITHGHGDHVGGLLHDGEPAFPKATLTMAVAEHQFWMGDGAVETRGAETVLPVRQALAAYNSRLRLITEGEVIHSGEGATLESVPIPGHTPGHIGLELRDGGSSITALVDTFHASFQLWNLNWCPRFDSDPETAIHSRKDKVTRAASSGGLVHLYHLPFPGIGYIRKAGEHWSWEITT